MHRPPPFAVGILHGPDRTVPRRNRQSPGPASAIRQIVRIQTGRARAAACGLLHPRRHSSGLDPQSHSPALPCCRRPCIEQRTPQGLQMRAARQWQARATGPGQASTSPNHTRCQFFLLGCPCTVNTHHRPAVGSVWPDTGRQHGDVLSCCSVHCTAKVADLQWNIALIKQQR